MGTGGEEGLVKNPSNSPVALSWALLTPKHGFVQTGFSPPCLAAQNLVLRMAKPSRYSEVLEVLRGGCWKEAVGGGEPWVVIGILSGRRLSSPLPQNPSVSRRQYQGIQECGSVWKSAGILEFRGHCGDAGRAEGTTRKTDGPLPFCLGLRQGYMAPFLLPKGTMPASLRRGHTGALTSPDSCYPSGLGELLLLKLPGTLSHVFWASR